MTEPLTPIIPDDAVVCERTCHGTFNTEAQRTACRLRGRCDALNDKQVVTLRQSQVTALEAERTAHAELVGRHARLVEAGTALLNHYVALVESGDAGFWDAEDEPVVIDLRAALDAEAIVSATSEQRGWEGVADADE